MAKHTPGPWRQNGFQIEGPRMGLVVATATSVRVGWALNTEAEGRANARLIAVAPDLYEFVAGVSNITDIGKSHDEDVRLLTALKDIAGRLLAKAEPPNA